MKESILGCFIKTCFSLSPYCVTFQTRSPSKAASMFSGTQDKCATCGKTAYPLEKVGFEDLGMSICCNVPKYLLIPSPVADSVPCTPSPSFYHFIVQPVMLWFWCTCDFFTPSHHMRAYFTNLIFPQLKRMALMFPWYLSSKFW